MNVKHTTLHVVTEAQMPSTAGDPTNSVIGRPAGSRAAAADLARLILVSVAALAVVFVYIGVPIALLAGDRLDSLLHAALFALAAIAVGTSIILGVLHSTNLDVERVESAGYLPRRLAMEPAVGRES